MDVARAREVIQGILDKRELFPDLGLEDDAGLAETALALLGAGEHFELSLAFVEGLVALREDAQAGEDVSFWTLAPIVLRKMGCKL